MLEIVLDVFPELTTERLVLRQLRAEDSSAILALRSDPEAMRYLDRPMMKNEEEAADKMEQIRQAYQQNEGIYWVISLAGADKMIGDITFWRFDKAHHRAEIGYMLMPPYQGKGYMQEAITAALQYAFEQLRFHSIEANVNPENTASIKLLERNGFIREAYFRENYYFDGKFLDSAIYSLLTPIGR